MPEPRSPLAGTAPVTGPDASLSEVPIASLVQIAAWPGQGAALAHLLGLPALPGPGRSRVSQGVTLLDGGPDRWLALGDSDLPAKLDSTVPGEMASVTDLSHARLRLRLTGPRAATILAKGTAVDLRDRAFPEGAVAWTTINHIGVVLYRARADAFDLFPYRGFALALSDWLRQAVRPDGLQYEGVRA